MHTWNITRGIVSTLCVRLGDGCLLSWDTMLTPFSKMTTYCVVDRKIAFLSDVNVIP